MKTKAFFIALIFAGFSNLFAQVVVNEFSWAKRHGNINYTTSPQNQKIEGPCGIFAGVALVESIYDLYFNIPNNIDFDLSESQVYSNCNTYDIGSPGISSA